MIWLTMRMVFSLFPIFSMLFPAMVVLMKETRHSKYKPIDELKKTFHDGTLMSK